MTDTQYLDAVANAICAAMIDLFFEVEYEYDPEVIKAKIKMRTKKEASPDATRN